MKPTITIVTVVFNGRVDIARTVDSVLSQDHRPIEYIVVDGHSTDGTQEVVLGYRTGIDRFISEPDRGVYDAMNKAIVHASGELLLFMNCGDVFTGPTAVSDLLAAAVPGEEQALFGWWIRRGGPGGDKPCAPDLRRGLFNHQAIAYSRSLHDWLGLYVSVPGFTTADYLFFATLISSRPSACRTVSHHVAVIDVHGMSAGVQTLSQKHAIDFLHGNTSRWKLAAILALHPLYVRLKRWWPRWR